MGFTEIAAFAGQTQLPLGSEEELGGPPQSVAPVQRADRIFSLDVLRVSALLGILMLNIDDFAGPEFFHDIPIGLPKPAFVGSHAHLNLAIVFLKWVFFERKMRALAFNSLKVFATNDAHVIVSGRDVMRLPDLKDTGSLEFEARGHKSGIAEGCFTGPVCTRERNKSGIRNDRHTDPESQGAYDEALERYFCEQQRFCDGQSLWLH
jgi:hypothetical protein